MNTDTISHKSFYLPSNSSLLLYTKLHSSGFTLTRSSLIIGRIKQIANFFALLTLCWVVVDLVFLPKSIWLQLILARTFTCLCFIFLATSCSQQPNIQRVYTRLFLMFAIPIGFLFTSFYILNSVSNGFNASAIINVYSQSPFLIAAGISFFPLTIIEIILLLALPMTAATGILIYTFPDLLGVSSGISMIWILLLIISTSAMASISQIGFMLKLFDDTAHDSLTGLFNRKIGKTILDQQFQVALRGKTAFTILFIDIDNFKRINDQFGHDAGDTVLMNFSESLKKCIRYQDIVIRWGGEEFLIALPNTDIIRAKVFISRLAIGGFGICPDGSQVSASIGMAEYMEDKVQNLDMLTNLADKRVYMAKQAGRNCYVIKEESYPILQ